MALGRLFGKKKKDEEEERAGSAGAAAAQAPREGAVGAAAAEVPPEKAAGRTGGAQVVEGRLARLRRGLARTRKSLGALFPFGRKLDDDLIEEIEATLIQADFGPATAMDLTDQLRESYRDKEFTAEEIVPFLKERLIARLGEDCELEWAAEGPTVIVVAGVNGTGKTTSIAKLAHRFRAAGKSVILAAGDTFRAAAVEQLGIWSDRLGVEMVRGKERGDPAAVVFQAIDRAVEEGADVVIVDTAGRLHTEKNLMAQLSKIARVVGKKIPGAPHEVLQVLDATTGQNAIQQVNEFHRVMTVTGLILTKLDGTARGGVIFPILDAAGLPVKFIGVGEALEDLQAFDPQVFVEALFE